MEHMNSEFLVDYWNRLRNGRAVPDQAEIDPRAIRQFLPAVFILDASNPSFPTYRLAGTALCKRAGFELRGTNFFAQWDAQSFETLSSLLRRALRLRRPLCLRSAGRIADNGQVELETTLAPISYDGCGPSRFVGLAQTLNDPVARTGASDTFQHLSAWKLINQDELVPVFPGWSSPRNAPDRDAVNGRRSFG